MKFADPVVHPPKGSHSIVLFAASQLFGGRVVQEDYFVNFNDECFVIADGVGGTPHGEVAAKLAAETAVWGYKHIRHRKFYWADKKLFLKRIFRSSNLAVWQKQRETGFETGLATTLLVAIVGAQKTWVGSVGDSSAYIYHKNTLTRLTREEVDEQGRLTSAVGIKRAGLISQIAVRKFGLNDCLVLATDGVARYVADQDIITACSSAGVTTNSMQESVLYLLRTAQENRSTDNMTACLVKRIEKQPPPLVSN